MVCIPDSIYVACIALLDRLVNMMQAFTSTEVLTYCVKAWECTTCLLVAKINPSECKAPTAKVLTSWAICLLMGLITDYGKIGLSFCMSNILYQWILFIKYA